MIENTYNIWVPSLQKFVRFKEIKNHHHFYLYKASVISDHELLFAFSNLLQELCAENLDTTLFTILDKYIIFVYLRMICVGTIINYNFVCPKCQESGKDTINLNNFVVPFRSILDQKYEKTIQVPGIDFECHLPTIAKELKTSLWIQENDITINDIEHIPTNHALNVMNHIKEIKISGQLTNFSDLSIQQQIIILKNIPSIYISEISNKFIGPILAKLSETDVLTSICSSQKCKHPITIPLQSINEILKFILVEDPESYLNNIIHLSQYYNFSPKYTETRTVSELNMIKTFIENKNKKPASEN